VWCFLSQHHKVLESLLIINFIYVYTVLMQKFLFETHSIGYFSYLYVVVLCGLLNTAVLCNIMILK